MLWAAVSHQEVPEKAHAGWLEKWGKRSPVEPPIFMRDDPADYPPIERASQIADRNRRTTETVLEKILPLIS